MNRFLSKKEKPGGPGAHKRDKSRDKSGERTVPAKVKVLACKYLYDLSPLILRKRKPFSKSMSSISAAFSNPHGKSSPILQTTRSTIYTSSANSRPGLFLQTAVSSDGLRSIFKTDPQKKADKELSAKISKIKDRLQQHGFTGIEDEQVNYALSSEQANGDVDKAFGMVLLFQESVEGQIKVYDPKIHMVGAVNREYVTCYLDSLLFAMFARLGSFEPILHNTFEDEPRRRLATLIRLWVNMLRSGKLITTDITRYLQEALAACGWPDAARLEQQDTSEAFSFITEQLLLPLLTLKMDIYHTGADDDPDDHKVVHERLLEVGIPEDHDPNTPIKFEDCLEGYFNNNIEVTRNLHRSNTISSVRSARSHSTGAGTSPRLETREISWSQTTTSWSETPTTESPITPVSPGGRKRGASIFQQIVDKDETGEPVTPRERANTPGSMRKGSKAVMMPAWQFYNLLPWNTQHSARTDEDVATHFEMVRPVLGICLKRYSMTENGEAKKNKTFVDIPLDIRLPHFVEEDMRPENDPIMGNFKLSLQSVICHQGDSVNSGHYISLVRGTTEAPDGDIRSNRRLSNIDHPPHYSSERWIKFDDLANPRVSYVDIEQALRDETPYLLFYQVQPTVEYSLPPCEVDPPSYVDSGIGLKVYSPVDGTEESYFEGAANGSATNGSVPIESATHGPGPSIRFSSELERPDPSRRSLNIDERPDDRRGSTAMTEISMASTASSAAFSSPVTPNEDSTAQRMSRAAARFKKTGSKSRPTSASGEGRLSLTLQRLNWKNSREVLTKNGAAVETERGAEMSDQLDGPMASSRNSVVVEEHALKPGERTPERSKSKMGRKRDKSKEPTESSEKHHSHLHKTKGKGNEGPERECITM
ncbi:hypothetical protein LSUB1_G008364 [Lachnellula subtilissima]|uniref:ubiquitinyl hydrolase 1 n=1 Tax=Lachnellula subtilissima TaxID=602034 RepID=A0A8H8RD17_9HELO|nr:hypothetical protein LSUB1_G008364 [Lachnellula subtilissima]